MAPAGLGAFDKCTTDRSAIYAYEQRRRALLNAAEIRMFRANENAWSFFRAQAPSYQRTVTYWVMSGKREETRARRLATLIADSVAGRRVGLLSPKSQRT